MSLKKIQLIWQPYSQNQFSRGTNDSFPPCWRP